jgi:hypothetical protein
VLKKRDFEYHFLTTSWPKIFFLGIIFFGGENPPIANKFLSTVLVVPAAAAAHHRYSTIKIDDCPFEDILF